MSCCLMLLVLEKQHSEHAPSLDPSHGPSEVLSRVCLRTGLALPWSVPPLANSPSDVTSRLSGSAELVARETLIYIKLCWPNHILMEEETQLLDTWHMGPGSSSQKGNNKSTSWPRYFNSSLNYRESGPCPSGRGWHMTSSMSWTYTSFFPLPLTEKCFGTMVQTYANLNLARCKSYKSYDGSMLVNLKIGRLVVWDPSTAWQNERSSLVQLLPT